MKKKFGLIKKLVLLFATLVLCIALTEGVARLSLGGDYPMSGGDPGTVRERLLNEHFASRIFQRSSNKALCYELKPGGTATLLGDSYTINRRGLRGPEIGEQKPADVVRIVVSGDSFVFGVGENDLWTIPAILERKLQECGEGGKQFQVINSGVPGFNVGQMKEYLLQKSMSLNPDLVVLIVSANDIVADYLQFNTLFGGLYADFLPLPYSWKPALWRLSVAYRCLVQRYKTLREGKRSRGLTAEEDLAFFKRQVFAVEKEARARGMGFLCVILPMLEPFDAYPYEKQHEDMHRALEGLDCVDLLPRMRPYDVRELWFDPSDHHLNARANLGVVRMIMEELEGRGMISLRPGALPEDPLEPLYGPGDLVLVDLDADPLERGNHPGAVFKVDPESGALRLVSADPAFREPVDLVFDPSGDLLVLDNAADPDRQGWQGAVFQVDKYTGRARKVLTSELFQLPNSLLLDGDGRMFISDKHCNPQGLDQETGALLVYDPSTKKLEVLSSGAAFAAPGPLSFAPGGKLYFIDADSNPNGYLDPHGNPATPGVLFEVDRVTGAFETLIEFKDTVSPIGIVPLEDGRLIVIDANADPLGLGYDYFPGGLLMVDPLAGEYEFIHGSPRFLDPTRGAVGLDGRVYFTDANADPRKLGPDGAGKGISGNGRGAVWRFDYRKGELSLVAADQRFVNPTSLKVVPRD